MILSLQATRQQDGIQHFFCTVDDLESGLDVLTMLVQQGETVLEAHIVDDDLRTDIPLAILDGQPFRQPMRRLQKQWKKILEKPIGKGSVHNLEVKACRERLLVTQQAQAAHIQLCVGRLTTLQQRAEQTIHDKIFQRSVVHQYQVLIDRHYANLARLEGFQQRNQRSLNRLNQ